MSPLETVGLVYVSDIEPGIRRERKGKGFSYRLGTGKRVTDLSVLARIKALGLPPAYDNVWICTDPAGHLQATGFDARGRKQYRYHADWQALRSGDKFDQLLSFAAALPRLRRRIDRDLEAGAQEGRGVLAAVAMLLDTAYLRVGNRIYTRENKTYGATTLLKRHISLKADRIELKFVAKGGKKVHRTLKHPRLQRTLEAIADLPGRTLFEWRDADGVKHAVDSSRLNAYLAEAAGVPVSAKTFRTWGGSLAAFKAACETLKAGDRPTAKQLCMAAAEELHNTPAVCRKSYVHPAVLSLTHADVADRIDIDTLRPSAIKGLKPQENRLAAFLEHAARQQKRGAKKA